VVGRQNADKLIADTLHLRDVAMATTFWLSVGYNFGCEIARDTLLWVGFRRQSTWLSIYGMHIGVTWRIRQNRPCAAAMRPYVNLLWPLVFIIIIHN